MNWPVFFLMLILILTVWIGGYFAIRKILDKSALRNNYIGYNGNQRKD